MRISVIPWGLSSLVLMLAAGAVGREEDVWSERFRLLGGFGAVPGDVVALEEGDGVGDGDSRALG